MGKVRVGFVGAGGIANVHLQHVSKNERALLTAICDIHEETALLKVKQYGGTPYTNVDEMLENEALDALFISVPPFAHEEIEEKAAKKGIPLEVSSRIYQKEEKLPEGITWTQGLKVDLPGGNGFMSVEKLIPPTPKSLDEARGYVIADYQDQLEKEWVASLQKKYPVTVNEEVLMSLVKK